MSDRTFPRVVSEGDSLYQRLGEEAARSSRFGIPLACLVFRIRDIGEFGRAAVAPQPASDIDGEPRLPVPGLGYEPNVTDRGSNAVPGAAGERYLVLPRKLV